jgi:hypothetical protein
MDRILLAYERKGHSFDGYFDFTDDSDEKNNCRDTFHDVPFRLIMNTLINEVRKDPDAKVLFMRLEQQPVPIAVELDPHLVDLIHKDPVMFLRHMDPFEGEAQRVQVGRMNLRKESVKHVAPQPIPAGYDTLADAFGNEVYCRVKRGGATECPLCGRWGQWTKIDIHGGHIDRFVCDDCAVEFKGIGVVTSDGGWFKIPVSQLLSCAVVFGVRRFFLPRAWNKPGPWISLEDLRKKYETFTKEKEQWKPTRTPTDDTSE